MRPAGLRKAGVSVSTRWAWSSGVQAHSPQSSLSNTTALSRRQIEFTRGPPGEKTADYSTPCARLRAARPLLVAQRVHRIEPRGTARRVPAEEQADRAREAQRQRHRAGLDQGGPA